jgi:hypothetical protein
MGSGTLKSYIEAPRWAAFPKFLKDECFMLNLKIVRLDIDKGWVRETVRFEIEGGESDLLRFKRSLEASVKEYNA